ncbi:MAG: hypothetical protein WDN08_21040 [Rhizomicrobium sp.]
MTTRLKPTGSPQLRGTPKHAELMMEMLVMLLEEFSALGLTDEAGPHIHELMGIAYRSARQGAKPSRLSPSQKPARQSAATRASAVPRP